ncbi:hypothetical protein [Streptomyces sp. NPDC001070]
MAQLFGAMDVEGEGLHALEQGAESAGEEEEEEEEEERSGPAPEPEQTRA